MNTPEKELIFDPNGELLRHIEAVPSFQFYRDTTQVLTSYMPAHSIIATSGIIYANQFMNGRFHLEHLNAFTDGASAAFAAAVLGKETLKHASFDEELVPFFRESGSLFEGKRQSSIVEALARSSIAKSRYLAPETIPLAHAVLDTYYKPRMLTPQDSLARSAQRGFCLTVQKLSRDAFKLLGLKNIDFDTEINKIYPNPDEQ